MLYCGGPLLDRGDEIRDGNKRWIRAGPFFLNFRDLSFDLSIQLSSTSRVTGNRNRPVRMIAARECALFRLGRADLFTRR
jgi:hypothetical protein